MASYGTLKANILNELLPNASNTAVLDAAVSAAIAHSIQYYSASPFWFNEDQTSFVTVASRSEYTAPSVMTVPISLVIARGSYNIPLHRKPLHWTYLRMLVYPSSLWCMVIVSVYTLRQIQA
jgi:hypothetical protein